MQALCVPSVPLAIADGRKRFCPLYMQPPACWRRPSSSHGAFGAKSPSTRMGPIVGRAPASPGDLVLAAEIVYSPGIDFSRAMGGGKLQVEARDRRGMANSLVAAWARSSRRRRAL